MTKWRQCVSIDPDLRSQIRDVPGCAGISVHRVAGNQEKSMTSNYNDVKIWVPFGPKLPCVLDKPFLQNSALLGRKRIKMRKMRINCR